MLLHNAWVHDGRGGVARQDVLVEDGVIVRVADHIEGDGEDLTGMHLTPGFVDPYTFWGINGSMTEIRPSSEDNDEKSDPVTPELDIRYAFNGRAITVQQLGLYGLTAVGVVPTDSNIFGGRVAAFTTDGLNPFRMLLRGDVAVKASTTREIKKVYGKRGVAPMTKMRIFQQIASYLRQAAEYDPEKEGTQRNEKLAVLRRVVEGEMPLWITCDSAEERQRVMEIVAPYEKLRVVFTACFDLAESDLALDPARVSLIDGFDGMDCDPRTRCKDYAMLARIIEKGIPVAISCKTTSMYGRETQLWEGYQVARVVDDPERVLSMMTLAGARLLGIDGVTGSIEAGKRADLTIWSKHPLTSFRSRVVRCMSAGRTIYQEGDEKKCYV